MSRSSGVSEYSTLVDPIPPRVKMFNLLKSLYAH